jgi:hypothetical protein
MEHHLYALVANAAMARLLQRGPERSQGWSEVECLHHPAARQHAHDRGPQRHGAQSTDRSGLAPRQSDSQHERLAFARQVDAWLQQRLQAPHSPPLLVLASQPFLGDLLAQMDAGTRRQLHSHHALDLTALPLDQLSHRLQQTLHT